MTATAEAVSAAMRKRDIARQCVVLVSATAAVLASFVGSGAAGGTPIAEAAGGALSADATPIAPAGPAFAIWTLIYAGLLAYAVWQFLPHNRGNNRQRSLGYPVAATLILNAAWILSVQAGLLAGSALVIIALLIALAYTFALTTRTRPTTRVESVVADGTIGLYLGWVCVATAANITALLTAVGFDGFGASEDAWAVAVLAVTGAVGLLLAFYGRGRLSPAASLCWGLAWVAVARLSGNLLSTPTAVAALVAATGILLATIAIRVANARGERD